MQLMPVSDNGDTCFYREFAYPNPVPLVLAEGYFKLTSNMMSICLGHRPTSRPSGCRSNATAAIECARRKIEARPRKKETGTHSAPSRTAKKVPSSPNNQYNWLVRQESQWWIIQRLRVSYSVLHIKIMLSSIILERNEARRWWWHFSQYGL